MPHPRAKDAPEVCLLPRATSKNSQGDRREVTAYRCDPCCPSICASCPAVLGSDRARTASWAWPRCKADGECTTGYRLGILSPTWNPACGSNRTRVVQYAKASRRLRTKSSTEAALRPVTSAKLLNSFSSPLLSYRQILVTAVAGQAASPSPQGRSIA